MDWYQTGGLILMLAGVVGGLWALFQDRSRGRRRCPRCWYDLGGAADRLCSECGHVAPSDRALLRTRRRWGRAVVAVTAILVGFVSVSMISGRGWVGLVPTAVLVRMMPSLESGRPELFKELARRMDGGELREAHWRLLYGRCLPPNKALCTVRLRTRDVWPEGRPVHFTASIDRIRSGISLVDAATLSVSIRSPLEGAEELSRSFTGRPSVVSRGGQRLQRWFDATFSGGVVGPGRQSIPFVVETRIACRVGAGTKPVTVRRETLEVPVTVSGRVEEQLSPASPPGLDVWLTRFTDVLLDGNGFWLTVGSDGDMPLEEPLTLAVVAELCHHGEPVVTGAALRERRKVAEWVEKDGVISHFQPLGMFGGRWRSGAWPEPGIADPRGWTLRLRGSGEVALRDFAGERFWRGEIEIPLRYRSTSGKWVRGADVP